MLTNMVFSPYHNTSLEFKIKDGFNKCYVFPTEYENLLKKSTTTSVIQNWEEQE